MAAGQAAVAMAASHFVAFDDASQEIYFMCEPYKLKPEYQVEISPSCWAEILPSFNVIEVAMRPRQHSNTRAVREQAEVLSQVQGSDYDYDYRLAGGRDGPV